MSAMLLYPDRPVWQLCCGLRSVDWITSDHDQSHYCYTRRVIRAVDYHSRLSHTFEVAGALVHFRIRLHGDRASSSSRQCVCLVAPTESLASAHRLNALRSIHVVTASPIIVRFCLRDVWRLFIVAHFHVRNVVVS